MTRARRVLGSGWIPALLVYVVAAVAMRHYALVSARDIGVYTVWLAWAHALPGTLLWRLLDWRPVDTEGRGRPFVEDVALGAILGLVVSIPVYLLLVMAGIPWAVAAWPLLVLVPLVATGRGRRLITRRQVAPTPAWWSWSLAILALYVVGHSLYAVWGEVPLNRASLRASYVDEPYHLSLLAEFRHHFPAEVPYVAGTPLRYHWLVYPFLAMGTWGSGVLPVAVLRILGPAALSAAIFLGVSVAASRMSGRRWAGVAAAGITCVLTPLDVMGWTPDAEPWQPSTWLTYDSPTQLLATAISPLLVVIVVGLVTGAAKRPSHWILAAVVMLAAAGAKSAMLPLFVAGLCGTTVVMLVVRRRILWRVAGAAALSVVVFALATAIFYGSESRSMTISPLAFIDHSLRLMHVTGQGEVAGAGLRATLTFSYGVCVLAPFIGGLGLFIRDGWRRPVPWVLLGTSAAGLVAALTFSHPQLSQLYFLYSAGVPAGAFAALGLARMAGPLTRRKAIWAAASGALGLASAWCISLLTTPHPLTAEAVTDPGQMGTRFLLPLAAAAATATIFGLLLRALSRRVPSVQGQSLFLAACLVTGMCALAPVAEARTWLTTSPGPPCVLKDASLPVGLPTCERLVGPGGIEAAHWLHENTNPDELVATNTHEKVPGAPDYRNFWVSAYAERRVLVEGWSYIPPESVGQPSNEVTNRPVRPPFWDATKLRLNDEVFRNPTADNVARLHDRYGVDWLLADRREHPDLDGLVRVAKQRFHSGAYTVFEIDEPRG